MILEDGEGIELSAAHLFVKQQSVGSQEQTPGGRWLSTETDKLRMYCRRQPFWVSSVRFLWPLSDSSSNSILSMVGPKDLKHGIVNHHHHH